MSKPKLTVVDDEPALAGFVRDVAELAGYQTEQFHHAEAFKRNYSNDADIIVLDLLLPDMDGVEVIRFLAERGCNARLVLISGFDPGVLHSAQELAIEHGLNFAGCLSKPFRHHELLNLLNVVPVTSKRKSTESTSCRLISVDELHNALRRDELVVYYQPKIDLKNGIPIGLEALVRWQHPTKGLLPPDLFIPMAEQYGLIDDLTWVVLNQVAAQCHSWNVAGIELSIAVNMSASTLRELSLPERMSNLIQHHDIDVSQLMLEVTETALMQELIKSLDILTRLRMKGFQLSIDDFGTGYSSLVQLYRAPFSELKVDRSFVLEMENNNEASAIIETVILLGHKLGMKVVAEGVETAENLLQLATMGCDLAQGYHIARPMPGDEITVWLEHKPMQALGA